MSGSVATKIRQLIGYDKKNANHIQKKTLQDPKGKISCYGR